MFVILGKNRKLVQFDCVLQLKDYTSSDSDTLTCLVGWPTCNLGEIL